MQNHLPNINSKTKAGQTPLMIAASFGNLDAVKWKWKCFRDCNILRFYPLSIYLCAVCKGHVLCNIFGIERLLSLKFTSWTWASCGILAEYNDLVLSSWLVSITVWIKTFFRRILSPSFWKLSWNQSWTSHPKTQVSRIWTDFVRAQP